MTSLFSPSYLLGRVDLQEILSAYIVLFAVIDIFGSTPVIISLKKQGRPVSAWKAASISCGLLLAFFFAGDAMLKAADTGQNFWAVFGAAVLVFCIVQIIIDLIVTPKIMGKAMSLNPAILLLSLSIWGALLGFIGLIIALPLTTIIMAYWQRYVTREHETDVVEETEDSSQPA